jgi:hypothetical protein
MNVGIYILFNFKKLLFITCTGKVLRDIVRASDCVKFEVLSEMCPRIPFFLGVRRCVTE